MKASEKTLEKPEIFSADKTREESKYTRHFQLLPEYFEGKQLKFSALAHLQRPRKIPKFKSVSGADFLVFVDGYFFKEHSQISPGVLISQVSVPLTDEPKKIPLLKEQGGVWGPLFIEVKSGQKGPVVLQLIYLSTSAAKHSIQSYRHHLVLEAGVQLTLIEDAPETQGASTWLNSQLNVQVGEQAYFQYQAYPRLHSVRAWSSGVWIKQAIKSRAEIYVLGLSDTCSCLDYQVDLCGESAQFSLAALPILGGQAHFDLQVTVDHLACDTHSDQTIKGVVGGRAQGVLRSKVKVSPGLERVSSRQYNPTILLSSLAEMDSVPELEIYSKSVQCSHGATVGALDEEALFYLQSRGLTQEAAAQVLLTGFIGQVIERLPLAMRALALPLCEEKLSGVLRENTQG